MVCVPNPATLGSKLLLVTPVPLYVPPVGVAKLNGYEAVVKQTLLVVGALTTGKEFTVTVAEPVEVQPARLVAVTV